MTQHLGPPTTFEDFQDDIDPRITRSRNLALHAALDIIAESGARAVTMEAVAKRSNLSKTTVYRHWPDSNALVVDVLTKTLPPPCTIETGDLEADLLHCAQRICEHLNTTNIRAALAEAIARAHTDPRIHDLVERHSNRRLAMIASLFASAQSGHRIHQNLEPEYLATLFLAPLLMQPLVTGQKLTPTDAAAHTAQLTNITGWHQPIESV